MRAVRLRWFLTPLAVAALAFGLSACGGGDSSSSSSSEPTSTEAAETEPAAAGEGGTAEDAGLEGKRAAILMGPNGLPFLDRLKKYYSEKFAGTGLELEFLRAEDWAADAEARNLNQAISNHANVILWQPAGQEAARAPLMKAKQEEIPVIITGVPPTETIEGLYTSYSSIENKEKGRLGVETFIEGLEAAGIKSGEVAVLNGQQGQAQVAEEEEGEREAFEAHPQFKVVAEVYGGWDPVKAGEVTRPVFAKYGSSLVGLYSAGGPMGGGAITTAEESGLNLGTAKGDFVLSAGDCDTTSIQAIRDGKMYSTLNYGPVLEGEAGAEAVEEVLSGQTLELRTVAPVSAITKANLKEYGAECEY